MKWPSIIPAIFLAVPVFGLQNTTVSLERTDTRPRVVNGGFTERALRGALAAAMGDIARSTEAPVWGGYAIPARITRTDSFQQDGCCPECRLESSGGRYSNSVKGVPIRVDDLVVFVRFEKGTATRVRLFNPGCTVDATGTSIIWLTGVSPVESISYLESIALADSSRSVSSAAISAIALHGNPAADAALERLAAPGRPEPIREQSAFWIASNSTPNGIALLRKLAREDSDTAFRKYLTFPFSITSDNGGLQELMRMAHEDEAQAVRGQALFWMAQKAGSRIAAEIATSVDNDPDTEVKKQAVFALAQIPNGEGIPKLIDVARSNRNAAVRKQAVFWLGQSHDPQALKFIEDVLTH